MNSFITTNIPPERLLSHRLRGFDSHESTLAGLKAALARNIRHVEIDVRLTKDSRFLVSHDPFFQDRNGIYRNIRDYSEEEMRSAHYLDSVPSLDDMLNCFKENASGKSLIHVDVKDGGDESNLISIIRRHDLIERSVIVSWLPSVLHNVASIEPNCRLCYSHITFTRMPSNYPIAKALLSKEIIK